jgi:hypothetical protein
MKFMLAYLKTLTNSRDCSERRNTILVLLSFSHWSILSSVDSWLSEQLFNSQVAIRKPEQASWRGIFTISFFICYICNITRL